MDLPGYDQWKCTPPDEPACVCGAPECEECAAREADEAAYYDAVDRQIDEAAERKWDR